MSKQWLRMQKQKSRLIGIDYGLARIGLAISDENKIIASPLSVIKAEKKLENTSKKIAEELKRLEEEYGCHFSEIVVGLPLHMSGRVGMLADEVKEFVKLLQELTTSSIVTWDERLTSAQAERYLKESGMTRKKKAKLVDKVAAAIILQCYLDAKI